MRNKNGNIVTSRLVRSYVTSVISISIVLTLVAVAAIFASNAHNVSSYFKENMTVSVILKQSVSEKEAESFADMLLKRDYVKDGRYVSKEEGAEEMKALLGENFLDVFESSPIPVSVDIHLDGKAITPDSLNVIREELKKNVLVEDVVYQETLVEALNSNLRKIGLVTLILILLLTVVSFVLISNTVRLDIYARRFTIHTMSLVGAERSFIARPFVLHSVIEGAVSGVLASGAVLILLASLNSGSGILSVILDNRLIAFSLAGVILLGILICVASAIYVVSKVACFSKDDLYY
ncbi:MAG: permease-like cell division protein FtsX [Bacteroidales bacterium]|nr:permease-like cell division protein FtsX [Candidatus Cacconaster merdequi]